MQSRNSKVWIRPLVRRLKPYVPGEQPKIPGLIKLNTNENPYSPAPEVLQAVKNAVDGRLRLYPNPTAEGLRLKLARLHGCRPENIIVGNGSDEILAMAVRCFVEPLAPGSQGRAASRNCVQFFAPSYSLYPVLADIHGARSNAVPLHPDFMMPSTSQLKQGKLWDFAAALTLVTTPNAPSGRGYPGRRLAELCRVQKGVVLLDEAYVDFAEEDALELGLRMPNVLVARTFSKAYSLCYQRVGYCVGDPALIEALQKIRDSYNVNGLGQVAAEATLQNLPYYRSKFREIIQTRQRLSSELTDLDFQVFPSQTNFLLVRPPKYPAQVWLERLRDCKILVRWFSAPEVKAYLRITIGEPHQAKALVAACKKILRGG